MSKKYPLLNDKAWLYQKYWREEFSIPKIAEIVGCGRTAVSVALKKHGIQTRTVSPLLYDRTWLYQKYWIEELSTPKIGDILSCGKTTVCEALKKFNIERRTKSEALKGEKNPMFGKYPSEETRAKLRVARKNKKPMLGKRHTEKTKEKMRHKHFSEEAREKMREARKHRIFPSQHTKPEMRFEEICKKYNLPFKYVGDSSFWIGGKPALNPDFIHLTKKIVVEIFSWHHNELQRHCGVCYSRTYHGRKAILKKRGYKMIVFWQDDLDREDAEKRILSVLKRHKI